MKKMKNFQNIEEKKVEEKIVYGKLRPENCKWKFFRASGPGGQKVNKTSSGAELRVDLNGSKNFTEEEKQIIKEEFRKSYPKHITVEEELIVEASDSRSQKINRQSCIEKMEKMINYVLRPKPARIETKTPESQKQERLRQKELLSQKKRWRKKVELGKEF